MACFNVSLAALAPPGVNLKPAGSMEKTWLPTVTELGIGQSSCVLMLGSNAPAVSEGRRQAAKTTRKPAMSGPMRSRRTEQCSTRSRFSVELPVYRNAFTFIQAVQHS